MRPRTRSSVATPALQWARGQRRTPGQAVLIAMLHRTAARAAVATGDAAAALTRARHAVTLANPGPMLANRFERALDLAAIEGVIGSAAEQKSDAIAAIEKARSCNDAALEAEALIQQANGARKLGMRDEALRTCRFAYSLAQRCDRPDLAATSMEELLYAQTTWWLFDDALETARTGLDVARSAGPLAEAAFRQARATLWFLLERFSEAESELAAALRLATESRIASGIARSRATPYEIRVLLPGRKSRIRARTMGPGPRARRPSRRNNRCRCAPLL